jgi:hypothetical protein
VKTKWFKIKKFNRKGTKDTKKEKQKKFLNSFLSVLSVLGGSKNRRNLTAKARRTQSKNKKCLNLFLVNLVSLVVPKIKED